jgi:hypothetical protein
MGTQPYKMLENELFDVLKFEELIYMLMQRILSQI